MAKPALRSCALTLLPLRITLMTITLDDITRLRDGWRVIVAVGDLHIEVAKRMGVHSTTVYLTRESLEHIQREHPDITDADLLLSCLAVRHGWIMQELAKPNTYRCSYLEPHSKRRFAAALKIARPDREVLMVSFRRARFRETRGWQKRCETIRTHD